MTRTFCLFRSLVFLLAFARLSLSQLYLNTYTTASTTSDVLGGFPVNNALQFSGSFRTTGNKTSEITLDFQEEFPLKEVSLNTEFSLLERFRDLRITLYNAALDVVFVSPVLNPNCSSKSFLDYTFEATVPEARYLKLERLFDESYCMNCTCCSVAPCSLDAANQLVLRRIEVLSRVPYLSCVGTSNVTLPSPSYVVPVNGAGLLNSSSITAGYVFNRTSIQLLSCANIPDASIEVFATYGSLEFSCFSFVKVRENVPPIATCVATLQRTVTNGMLVAPIGVEDVANTTMDACDTVLSRSLSQRAVSCPDSPLQSITLTVRDRSGNEATCSTLAFVNNSAVPDGSSLAAPASISVGSAITVCYSSLNLFGNPSNANASYWKQVSGPAASNLPLGSSTGASLNSVQFGLSTFRFTAVGNGCISSSADVAVTRVANLGPTTLSIAGFTPTRKVSGFDYYNLGCTPSVTLNVVTSYPGGQWYANPPFFFGSKRSSTPQPGEPMVREEVPGLNGNVNFANSSDPSTTATFSGSGIFFLEWYESSPNCDSRSTSFIISFASLTEVTTRTPNSTLACGQTTAELIGDPPGGGGPLRRSVISPREGPSIDLASIEVASAAWDVVAQPFLGAASIEDATNFTTNITNLAVGTTVVQYTLSAPFCTSRSTIVTLTRPSAVPTANAGPNQDIGCRQSTQLAANSGGSSGTGQWSVVSAPGGTPTISNVNDPTTSLFNVNGTVVLRWTLSSPGCASNSDDVIIKQYGAEGVSPANPGPPQWIGCARSTYLQAIEPVNGIGRWSLVNGTTALLVATSQYDTALTGLRGNVTLRWEVTGDSCPQNYTTFVTVGSAPPNDPACAACAEVALGGENFVSSCDPPVPMVVSEPVTFNFSLTMSSLESNGGDVTVGGSFFEITGSVNLRGGSLRIGANLNISIGGALDLTDASVDLASELMVGGDVRASGNVSFVITGSSRIVATGAIIFSSDGSFDLSNEGSNGALRARQMQFAGRLILRLLRTLTSSRDNVVQVTVASSTASTTTPSGTLVRTEVPVATFESGSGSFEGVDVVGFSSNCDTLVSSAPVTTSNSLSVALQLSRDTTSPGCTPAPGEGGSSLSVGAIVGIVVGCLVLVAVFAVLLVLWRKREVEKAGARFMQRNAESQKRSSVYQQEEL